MYLALTSRRSTSRQRLSVERLDTGQRRRVTQTEMTGDQDSRSRDDRKSHRPTTYPEGDAENKTCDTFR